MPANSFPVPDSVTGLILAGGRASRMGGQDKGLMLYRGKEMVAHIQDQLASQCTSILINANRNVEVYSRFGYPVITDSMEGFQGPLAGILAGLEAADTEWLVTVPCDGPFIVNNFVLQLKHSAQYSDNLISVAFCHNRLQPVYALIKTDLRESLTNYLESGERKIDRWYENVGFSTVDFSNQENMFVNINTPEELRNMNLD